MTRDRLLGALASATGRCRAGWLWLRTRCTRRRVVVGALLVLGLGGGAIVTEALVRGHLAPPDTRVPTGLYSRTVAWDGTERSAVRLATMPGARNEWRQPVALDEIPESLVQAVLAIEDQRFLEHVGLDPRRIAGAFVANLRAGGIAEGGSTITQQLAKNLFLSARRTPLRKLREVALALALEARHSKEQILEAYLNEIYLGQDRGMAIHGVAAASSYYFGRDLDRITVGQAATLAAMIHAPNRLAPTRHPEAARQRRDLVLALMTAQGRLGEGAAERARREAMPRRAHPSRSVEARWFRDAAAERIPGRLPTRGAAVYTTLDARLQEAAEDAVQRGVARLPGRPEAALVALDPRSGEVLAMVGGTDYGRSQFNRAVTARRQPGSAFKPIVALAALSRDGRRDPAFTLASVVEDVPLDVATPEGPWRPANYDGGYRGDVTLREALEASLNVPFARIGLAVGPERIVETARHLGITTPLAPVPAIALGSGEVTLLELARAYGVLATGGTLAETRLVTASRVGRGELSDVDPAGQTQVADPAAAYLVTSALEGVLDHGTGAAMQQVRWRGALAGKTGTSNDWRDAWFVAYSPTLVVAVWVGHDDGTSLRRTGAEAALPIAARFLAEAGGDREDFRVPDGIVEAWVPDGNGWGLTCARRELFLEGTEPGGSCLRFDPDDWHLDLELDRGDLRELQREAARWLREQIRERLDELRDIR
ncbi:MAG: PBP1A family penicillin-binding protein [Gemmatimonadetes bacterium]|nr:PBP1A family penicillin-binding protein [Gemmatimonadota bacterium]